MLVHGLIEAREMLRAISQLRFVLTCCSNRGTHRKQKGLFIMHDVWIYAATTKLRYVGSYRRVVDSARRVACSLATSVGISTCR